LFERKKKRAGDLYTEAGKPIEVAQSAWNLASGLILGEKADSIIASTEDIIVTANNAAFNAAGELKKSAEKTVEDLNKSKDENIKAAGVKIEQGMNAVGKTIDGMWTEVYTQMELTKRTARNVLVNVSLSVFKIKVI
jgi:predicted PP-loop superfamily ATPase